MQEDSDLMVEKLQGINDVFKIEDIYKHHKDYVVDTIKKLVIYNESKMEELTQQFPELFHSKDDLLNNYFMNYINIEDWGKRPLAKLTHDIYNEFKSEE